MMATFFVNTTVDAVDELPGDGICDAGDGDCSLRAAIMEANALAGADEVTLPEGIYNLTIDGANENDSATGDLDVTDELTVNGNGHKATVIDASLVSDRILHVIAATVTVNRLALQGGSSFNGGSGISSNGMVILEQCKISGNGGFGGGGGISNSGVMSLEHSTITENGAGLGGGGISNSGTMFLNDSTVSANVAGFMNPIVKGGGGIENTGVMTLINTTVTKNTATVGAGYPAGGGIQNRGRLTLMGSSVTDNSASNVNSSGGGIANGVGGDVTLNQSIMAGNSADKGGGVFNDGMMTVTNSTVSGNAASEGGGIYNYGWVSVIKSTISGNTATSGGGIFNHNYVTATNSIVAGNMAGTNPNLRGNLSTSSSFNLLDVDPLLGPLANNGGSTPTHALLPGSPAIDAGDPNVTPPPYFDQRGAPYGRVQDGNGDIMRRIDIGAVELQPTVSVDGDFNDDGNYNCLDIDELVSQIAAENNASDFDLTGDGLVDLADQIWWLGEAGEVNLRFGLAYLPGDANLDGFVDVQDFNVWNANKFSVLPVIPGWCQANFNGDATVEGQDFLIWNQNKFTTSHLQIGPYSPQAPDFAAKYASAGLTLGAPILDVPPPRPDIDNIRDVDFVFERWTPYRDWNLRVPREIGEAELERVTDLLGAVCGQTLLQQWQR